MTADVIAASDQLAQSEEASRVIRAKLAEICAGHLEQIKKRVLTGLAECQQAEGYDDRSVRLFARLQRGRWEEIEAELKLVEKAAEVACRYFHNEIPAMQNELR